MLYYLFDWLNQHTNLPGMGVFQYLSFRAILAAITSLLVAWFLGKRIILALRRRLIGESIRELGPETHKKKAGTPTMGGLIILLAILLPVLLWGDLLNGYVWLLCLATLWMGLVGFADDYIKVFRKNKSGLKGRFKIMGQVGLGMVVGLTMVLHPDFNGSNPRVDKAGSIRRLSVPLEELGLRENDRVLRINGLHYKDYCQPAGGSAPRTGIQQLEVQRDGQRLVLNLSPGQSSLVCHELLGLEVPGFATRTNVPLLKDQVLDYGSLAPAFLGPWGGKIVFVLVAIFIVTAVSNAVNITDGIDGLAAGTSAIVGTGFGLMAYLSGNAIFSNYLNIAYIPHSGEILIFAAAFACACIGFLWYNAHPAMVFMGDTGSLALGSAIAVMALMVKKELLIPVMCGIFFIEALSVTLQVGWFKYTKRRHGAGRRIFRMAPLHHHYELAGWHEAKIVVRMWIVSILLVLLAIATLKLR